jgi:RNA polymerase sigma-70 factor, ECF subfamily
MCPGINPRAPRCESDTVNEANAPNIDKAVRDQIVALLPRLRRFCSAITRSADLGDDLTQATIERALSRIDQWRDGTKLDSWMFRIAQNINIDQARSRKTRGISVDIDVLETVTGDDGREIVEARDGLARVQDAMANLPEDQRALLALVAIDGQSYKEASAILDIPIGTVMSRISRARATLALSFATHAPGGA